MQWSVSEPLWSEETCIEDPISAVLGRGSSSPLSKLRLERGAKEKTIECLNTSRVPSGCLRDLAIPHLVRQRSVCGTEWLMVRFALTWLIPCNLSQMLATLLPVCAVNCVFASGDTNVLVFLLAMKVHFESELLCRG